MSLLHAHLLCLALVAVDLAARAWRIRWILRGLGQPLSFRNALALNAFGDAACALTPLRVGGEPARLAGMIRSGVPAAAGVVGISMEVLAAWPVILVAAGWLVWRYAPAWWDSAGSRLAAGLFDGWPWLALVALVSAFAWQSAERVRLPFASQLRRPIRRILVYWRRMPRGFLLATVPFTMLNLASRVAILPVLALTLTSPPATGPILLGSFALLYSQLVLPTPAGAGPVELGFLAGVAGDFGMAEGWLLVAWRFYTSGLGVLLGVICAVSAFGLSALRRLMRNDASEATWEAEA
jgi:uncharacterized membrane protein YbhN (UPF0104 family)